MEDLDTLGGTFARDGFVQIEGFWSPQELDELEANLARFIRDVVPKMPKTEAMYEDYNRPETLKQVSHLEIDPFFASLMRNPKIVDLAKAFLMDEVVPQGVQLFAKPPGTGKPTPPHQDGYYFCLVPNEALTFWFPLDNIDQENGALHYVKGSHKKGVLAHRASGVLGFSQGVERSPDLGEEVTCTVRRGDCLIHHSLMVHSAGGNFSKRFRRALGLVYYAKRARVDKEAQHRYQDSLQAQRKEKGVV